MPKINKKLLAWRKKQPKGAIMKPETFEQIRRDALAKGFSEKRAEQIAGSAYWTTAKAKFRERAKR